MRKLIAAIMSLDNKIEGPNGDPDWIDAWSEDYGLTGQIAACCLGGKCTTTVVMKHSGPQSSKMNQVNPLGVWPAS